MNQVSWSKIILLEVPQKEITQISVWAMGWLDLATIMASWKKLRIHPRTKFFMQTIKASINCALPDSILHKPWVLSGNSVAAVATQISYVMWPRNKHNEKHH